MTDFAPLLTCATREQVEKQTRLASDAFATGKVAVAIVQLLFECKDWDGLNTNIVVISKRRQQLKQVLVEMVQEVFRLCSLPLHSCYAQTK